MVADPVMVHIGINLLLTAEALHQLKRLQYRAGIPFPAAQIIDLTATRSLEESMNEARHVFRMDIIPHLLSLVAEDIVFSPFKIAFHQITQKAVQFYARVIRAGEAPAAQTAGGHAKVSAVLLDHHIGSDFRCSKEGVFRLVDGKGFRDAIHVLGVIILPAGFLLLEADCVWQVAVDLVSRHVDKWRFWTELPCCFQQVQSTPGVGVKIVKGYRSSPIMRGLGSRMDNAGRPKFLDQLKNPLSVPYIQFIMTKMLKVSKQSLLTPASIPLMAEKYCPLVVVHTMDKKSFVMKEGYDLGTNKS